jgi:hypothetical protein
VFLFVPGVQQGGDLDVLPEEDSDKISTDGASAGKDIVDIGRNHCQHRKRLRVVCHLQWRESFHVCTNSGVLPFEWRMLLDATALEDIVTIKIHCNHHRGVYKSIPSSKQ